MGFNERPTGRLGVRSVNCLLTVNHKCAIIESSFFFLLFFTRLEVILTNLLIVMVHTDHREAWSSSM